VRELRKRSNVSTFEETRAAMGHRSPYPDVDIPDVPIHTFVLERASELGDKPALIDGPSGRTLTYEALAEGVGKAAAGMAARGLARGDVVGILAPNMPEWALVFHAVSTVGATNTTVNSLATEQELAAQLSDAEARFLVTVPPFLDRALPAAKTAGIEEVFVLGGEPGGATPFAELMDARGAAPKPDIDPAEDLVALPYSSGTTGLSKGVMLTHRNLVANVCQTEALHRVREDEVVIAVLPFFHIYGMTVVMNLALQRGATIVTMPRFELEPFLRLLQDHRVTRAYLVPPIVLALAKHPAVDDFDLSSVEWILSGAAPLDASLAATCAERLGARVVQGYGLTESSPVTHTSGYEPQESKPGSVGRLVPNTEGRVTDWATGREVEAEHDGELCVRGPQVMRGYLNNPIATSNTIDEDGWLQTGDIGHADEDGFFFVVDRLKELIKYKGYQVPPAELEAVLVRHAAIADAAVIPSPDEEAGEVPKAFVVRRADVTAEELVTYVAAHVAPYKRIRRVEFVEEIPKSATGKILRRVLVERERASTGASSR
jgi:acyl-CoA synthetase (AMP-forming)/AMP-acid ligase II